jgi:uncharacterized repeat protein (TIGR04138 family)
MSQDVKFWEAVRTICRLDDRFRPEAYAFVMESLEYTLRNLEKPRHVTADELLKGFCEHAKGKYGLLAHTVLESWGINTARDVGVVVYNLVDAGVLSKQDSDRYEDFDNGCDLKDILDERYFD